MVPAPLNPARVALSRAVNRSPGPVYVNIPPAPVWRVTWERVTPESAEHGDAEARGFVDCDGFRFLQGHATRHASTLREALDAMATASPARASLESVEASDSDPSGARWMTWQFSPDYVTGDSLSLSLHFPETVSGPSRARLVRLLSQ